MRGGGEGRGGRGEKKGVRDRENILRTTLNFLSSIPISG